MKVETVKLCWFIIIVDDLTAEMQMDMILADGRRTSTSLRILFITLCSRSRCEAMMALDTVRTSPNQVLTHAARAAAKQPFQPCRGDTRLPTRARLEAYASLPARSFARTVDGYHPSISATRLCGRARGARRALVRVNIIRTRAIGSG